MPRKPKEVVKKGKQKAAAPKKTVAKKTTVAKKSTTKKAKTSRPALGACKVENT